MEYSEKNGVYVIRLDRGEEVVETLRSFCEEKEIFGGHFTGLGAVSEVELGYINLETKEYVKRKFEGGTFEVSSLVGNVSEVGLHVHINVADAEHRVFGGHLFRAVVNPTLEVFLMPLDKISRKEDNVTGLKILDL